jgi:type IV pilus assembly protein PilY1
VKLSIRAHNPRFPRSAAARARSLVAGTLLTAACIGPVMADDTEIFVTQQSSTRPNILMIFDTSTSMNTNVLASGVYDPAITYPGSCSSNNIYWRRDISTDLTCNDAGANFFDVGQFVCNEGAIAISTAGRFQSINAGQWNPGTRRWMGLDPAVKNQPVECVEDAGEHGPNSTDERRYAANEV